MIAIILLAFLIPIAICILLYFTVVQKKLCNGDLHSCSASNVNLCVKSGTSDDDWKGMCTKLENKGNLGNLGTGLGAGPGWGQCVMDTNEKMGNKLNKCNECINDGTGTKYYIRDRDYCGDAYSADYAQSVNGDIVAWNYGPKRPTNHSCNNPGIVTNQNKDC